MIMAGSNIPLDWYVTFREVAVRGSISRAAEELCVSQPAASQCIRNLEEQLGIELFIREARGVRLSREGELILKHITEGLGALLGAEKLAENLKDLSRGTIHIGSSDTLTGHILPRPLSRFRRKYPGIRIHISNQTSLAIAGAVSEGSIDVGVVSLPLGGRSPRDTANRELSALFLYEQGRSPPPVPSRRSDGTGPYHPGTALKYPKHHRRVFHPPFQ